MAVTKWGETSPKVSVTVHLGGLCRDGFGEGRGEGSVGVEGEVVLFNQGDNASLPSLMPGT